MENPVVIRLLELTHKADNKIVLGAVYALGEGGPTSREVISRLLDLTHKSNTEIAAASASALGRIYRRR